eukprot:GHVS01016193.1.p1 GENE.GHVS01016193.1~~GHVS01016193.1.p1  ORF type:complete len:230 (+),score=55.55 GHVS01016193.1:270-959(+)
MAPQSSHASTRRSHSVILHRCNCCRVMLMRLLHWTVEEFQLFDNIRNAEIVVLEKTPECKFRLRTRLRRRIPSYFRSATRYEDNRPPNMAPPSPQQLHPERSENAHRLPRKRDAVPTKGDEQQQQPQPQQQLQQDQQLQQQQQQQHQAVKVANVADREIEQQQRSPLESFVRSTVEFANAVGEEASGGDDCRNMDLSSCIGEDGGGYGFSVNLGDGTEGFFHLGAGGRI